jgi:S1-C subfamily serine protease
LPFLLYGNSDDVKIGQWVLAIGYPLTLETTVTAGIISAKGRTLDINSRQSSTPVESFIQTDAAVNPGNSGGPLITTDGKLIGINSAIASPTGSFAGYSFTIPVNIVKKIIADIIKFGTVQRAFLGIQYPRENLSDELKNQNGIKEGEGVFVMDVTKEGAAEAAGIKKGDIITKVNGLPVTSGPEMVGQIATYRPGDKIQVTYKRNGKEYVVPIVLRNSTGTTDMVKTSALDKFGADLQTISKTTAKELGVNGGVEIRSINGNGLLSRVRIQEGYVIIKANGKEVKNTDDLKKIVEDADDTIRLEGMYPGYDGIYPIVINLNAGN